MKLLILSCFVSVGFGQLVTHWNGAVTPYDPANAAATAAHLAIKSHPYAFYGKREAEAEPEAEPQYLTYAGHHLGYSHLGYGYAGYPYTTFYGKREAEAEPQYFYGGYGRGYYGGYRGYYGGYRGYYGKRDAEAEPEAEPQYLTYAGHHLGYGHLGYGYAGYPYTTYTYGKREAEAEPQFYYGGYGRGYYGGLRGYYGGYRGYYGKRDAEADPQYVYGHHLGYSTLGYGYSGYTPYAYGYYG